MGSRSEASVLRRTLDVSIGNKIVAAGLRGGHGGQGREDSTWSTFSERQRSEPCLSAKMAMSG
eukprot:9662674-Alexandrium_andersonii.AAC.1